MKRKTIYIFLYRIISQPKSEYRPIELKNKQQASIKLIIKLT